MLIFIPPFIDLTCYLLSVCMWIPLINARIVSDLSSPSFRRYVRHVYPWASLIMIWQSTTSESMWLFLAIENQFSDCVMAFLDYQKVDISSNFKAVKESHNLTCTIPCQFVSNQYGNIPVVMLILYHLLTCWCCCHVCLPTGCKWLGLESPDLLADVVATFAFPQSVCDCGCKVQTSLLM